MKLTGVYKIISPSGRLYIGSAIDIYQRGYFYKKHRCKGQTKLYNSIKKYGWEAHSFEIIAITPPEKRLKWEHILGMYYNVLDKDSGLNLKLPGYDDIPAIYSDEAKDKMRKSQMGKKQSPETIKKRVAKNTGLKRSQEQIARCCKAQAYRKKEKKISGRKTLINLETGIFYETVREAHKSTHYTHQHLWAMLNGIRKNKTNLQYII